MDFVEFCNVFARKEIIKAAKRIINSDKMCHRCAIWNIVYIKRCMKSSVYFTHYQSQAFFSFSVQFIFNFHISLSSLPTVLWLYRVSETRTSLVLNKDSLFIPLLNTVCD